MAPPDVPMAVAVFACCIGSRAQRGCQQSSGSLACWTLSPADGHMRPIRLVMRTAKRAVAIKPRRNDAFCEPSPMIIILGMQPFARHGPGTAWHPGADVHLDRGLVELF